MKVGGNLKTLVGMILLATSMALAACSNAPNTISGLTSRPVAIDPGERIPPEEIIFAFEPFDGVPVNIGDSLSNAFLRFGASYSVNVTQRVKKNATHRVRGYLVATSDDTATIVAYTYDIFDGNGARVHRIKGQQIAGASFGDPWSAVVDGTVNQIATESLISIRNWIYSRS